MNTYGYDMKHFSEDALYDENGVKLVSSGIMVNRNGNTMLLLELENTTGNIVYITTSDIRFCILFVFHTIPLQEATVFGVFCFPHTDLL